MISTPSYNSGKSWCTAYPTVHPPFGPGWYIGTGKKLVNWMSHLCVQDNEPLSTINSSWMRRRWMWSQVVVAYLPILPLVYEFHEQKQQSIEIDMWCFWNGRRKKRGKSSIKVTVNGAWIVFYFLLLFMYQRKKLFLFSRYQLHQLDIGIETSIS